MVSPDRAVEFEVRVNTTDLSSAAPTRVLILDAAVRSFLEAGYEAASMDDIAVEAGVSRRTVFNQFDSKESLFRASVERLWAQIEVARIAGDDAALNDPAAGLRRLGQEVVRYWSQPEAVPLARMIIAEGRRFPFLREGYVRHGWKAALVGMTAFFQTLQDRGVLRPHDAEQVALHFVGMIKEPLWWPVLLGLADPPSTGRKDAVVEEAAGVILGFYAA